MDDRQANSYFKYMNVVVGLLLDRKDIVSMKTAENVLKSSDILFDSLTYGMKKVNAVRMVQLIMNCAIILYEYTSSWFSYFTTTFSGLSKIYECIFTNPVYGVLFFCTFYFRILGETDKARFNEVASFLGLSSYEDSLGNAFLEAVGTLASRITLDPAIILILKTVASNVVVLPANTGLETVMRKTLSESETILSTMNPAIYVKDRDLFDYNDEEIQEQLLYLAQNRKEIKKELKASVVMKKKGLKKKKLAELTEIKENGRKVCLSDCKRRVKTLSGCYCESDCTGGLLSAGGFFGLLTKGAGGTKTAGGRSWCWVDPDKCKRGKTLLRNIAGRAYDYCDPNNLSPYDLCFTGTKYEVCKRE